MLAKISLSSIIHRDTSLTRELEKNILLGQLVHFWLWFGVTTLGVTGSKLNLMSLEREWYCGWRKEGGVTNINIVATPCMPNLTVFCSKIIFWEQGPLVRVDTVVPLWRIFN